MSQGRHSSLSLTKGPKRGAGRAQRGKFHPVGNGWWKWLGKRNSPCSFSCGATSRCSSFTDFLHRPWMSGRVTRFCLCDSLWSCTQSDGYTHDVALSPSRLPFLFSHSHDPECIHPQQSDNPLIHISGSQRTQLRHLILEYFCWVKQFLSLQICFESKCIWKGKSRKKLCSIRGNVEAIGGYWFIGEEKTTMKKDRKGVTKRWRRTSISNLIYFTVFYSATHKLNVKKDFYPWIFFSNPF